jgi:hypothetical protein
MYTRAAYTLQMQTEGDGHTSDCCVTSVYVHVCTVQDSGDEEVVAMHGNTVV